VLHQEAERLESLVAANGAPDQRRFDGANASTQVLAAGKGQSPQIAQDYEKALDNLSHWNNGAIPFYFLNAITQTSPPAGTSP
jgi:hypothetical protein